MQRIILFFGAVLTMAALTAQAQQPDTALVLVHYKFTHVTDTTNRAHPHTENMALFVGKSAGAYWSYDGITEDEQFKKAWAVAAASSPDGNVMINRGGGGAGLSTQYYQYPNEQKLFTKENIMANDYVIESPMPSINWSVSGDTATFGGLHCQKATGHFKGRDYTAWFCPDLPVPAGPWKLNGLPGVIVDAHDAKNEVVFKFNGVEKVVLVQRQPVGGANADEKNLPPILRGLNYDPNLIQPPAGAIKTTQKEFDKLKQAIKKNPQAFADAVMVSNNGATDAPKMDKAISGPPLLDPVINNPIELPEKN